MLRRAERWVVAGLLAVLGLLGVIGVVSYHGVSRIRLETTAERRDRAEAAQLRALRLSLARADSALRAYALEADPTALASYHQSVAHQYRILDSLELAHGQGAASGGVVRLRELITRDAAATHEALASPAVRTLLLSLPRYPGVRAVVAGLEAGADSVSATRDRTIERVAGWTREVILAGALLALLVVIVVLFRVRGALRLGRQAQAELDEARRDLERRVEERTAELQREQERIARIASVSPAVLHSFRLGPEGRMSFPFAAERIADLYGVTGAALQHDATPALQYIHPEDAPRIQETIGRSRAAMTPWHQRWRVRHPAKGEIWIEGYSSPVAEPDGATVWHGVLVDATDAVRAEQGLRESEERLQTVIDSLSEGLIVSDLDGQLLHWNPAALEMHGFSTPEEWHRRLPEFRDIFELATPDGAETVAFERWPLPRIFAGESLQGYELRLRRRHSAWERVFSYGGAIVRQPGGTRLAVLTISDISQRYQAETALRARTADLLRSNRELEQFAYVASHDLREPLRAVAGCVQLLQNRYRGRLDARADELIAHAVDGASRMQRLIDDLLALSRLGTRAPRPEPTPTDESLHEALANLSAAITESGARVQTGPLPTIRVDRAQLTSLFQNLIGNAIKFCRGAPEVRVRAIQEGREWVFSVKDNGIGIEPRYHERIFGIFQRLHTRTEYPGTGMGLALCKKIVEQAGGRIWVDSTPGGGTTFFFTFPQDPPAPAGNGVHDA